MKILILGPYAPHGQVGAQRIISLSRFLIKNGHDVTVLCLSENSIREIDENGLTASAPDGVKVIPYDITNKCGSIMMKNYINGRECKKALKRLIKGKKFDAIIVSVGPFYTMNSMSVAKKNKIPYVLDYRDIHLSSPDKRKRTGLKNKIKFLMSYPARFFQEYNCIKNASKITVVSPEMRDNICSFFHIDKKRIEVVYNGYDDYSLRSVLRKEVSQGIFYIGYFGKLMYYNKSFTIMLFNAIKKLNSNGYKIKLMHIGPKSDEVEKYLLTKKNELTKLYEYVGQKDYKDGIELLSRCNACYLEYEMPEGPGTKVFDYIFLNKPIIGVVRPKISLEKLLRRFKNAFICYDEKDIEDAVKRIIEKKIEVLADNNDKNINEFSRSFQNLKFEKLLTKIVLGDKHEK